MKFKVTYPSGLTEEVEQSDCATIEQFANTKFGSVPYADHGITVEIVYEDAAWLKMADEARKEGFASQAEVDNLLSKLADAAEDEDADLAEIVRERRGGETVKVTLDELVEIAKDEPKPASTERKIRKTPTE